jgi:hypothetical protein
MSIILKIVQAIICHLFQLLNRGFGVILPVLFKKKIVLLTLNFMSLFSLGWH